MSSSDWSQWQNGAGVGENHRLDEEGGGEGAAGEREPEEIRRGRTPGQSCCLGERKHETKGFPSSLTSHQSRLDRASLLTNSRWLARFHHPPFIFPQTDFERLKSQSEADLASKLEAKTRGLEKIVEENENLRKEIKRVTTITLLLCYFFFCPLSKVKGPMLQPFFRSFVYIPGSCGAALHD